MAWAARLRVCYTAEQARLHVSTSTASRTGDLATHLWNGPVAAVILLVHGLLVISLLQTR
jgi:hypothetical protein